MVRSMSACLIGAALLCGQPVLAASADPLKVSGAAAAKGVGQVVVGAFNVGFIFESVDNTRGAQQGGLIGAFGGTTKAMSTLDGVTPAMMQAITDAAYADFTAQLAAKGFTVGDSAAMFASEGVAKLKPLASPVQTNIALEKNSKGKATFLKPSRLPALVMMPADFTPSGLSGIGTQMAMGQMGYQLAAYAKQANAAVIDVVYLIDFSNAKRPGAFSFGGIKVDSGMSVTAQFSRMTLIAPSGRQAVLTVNQPVAVEGDFAAMADASSGLDKTSQAVGNVAGGVAAAFGMGGFGLGKTRKFAFTAKPGAYEEGATKAATLANARLVDQLAALR